MSQTLSASMLCGAFGTAGRLRTGGYLRHGLWRQQVGRTGSSSLTILGVLVAFVLSAMTFQAVVFDGATFNETIYTWMTVGSLKMESAS
jgi:NADH-quinone oxidoreductase subunit L